MTAGVRLDRIRAFRLVCANLDRVAAFYAVLGFRAGGVEAIAAEEMARLGLAGAGRRIALALGPSRLDLDAYEDAGRPYPQNATACDLAFQHFAFVTDEIGDAWARATDAGARLISHGGPVTLPASSGGVTAVKFRDPEGHPLELLQFPTGSNTDWTGHGVLGIDHSAISVADLEASVAFYARAGLIRGDPTLNQGPTQAALDGLEAPVVDVQPLNPPGGTPPHLELLAYRKPKGRASPPLKPNDISATRIVWRADRCGLLRDPDGHLHELTTNA